MLLQGFGPPRSFGAAEIDALTRELGRKPTMAEIERKRQDMASAAQSPATLDALDARNKFYGARTLTETGGVKPEALGLHGVARPNLPPVQPTPVQPTATPAPPPPQPKPVTKVVGSSAIAPPRAKTEEASFTGISPTMDTVIDNYVDQISDNFDLANDPRFMQNKLHRTLTQQRFKQREGLPWPRAIPQRMKTAEEGADTDLATVDSIRAILKAHPEVSAFMGPIMGRTFEGVEDVASHVPILGRIGIPGIRKLGGAGIPNLPKNLELYAQQLSTMLTQLAASEAFVAGKGSIGQYLLNWVKENTASMNKNPQMFEGALRGIEDFAWAIHEGANRYRFPGKWTPSAKERYSSDVRHLGRETVPFKKQLPDGNVVDSSVWKHIQHIESGQRLVWDENKNTYVNEE